MSHVKSFLDKKLNEKLTGTAPGNTGIGWLTGSRPRRILFALWLSFSHADARICSAWTEVRWAGVGRACNNYKWINITFCQMFTLLNTF